MKAVTLRNLPPRVSRAITRRASELKTSLNKAVISRPARAEDHRSGCVAVSRVIVDAAALGRCFAQEALPALL